MAPPPTVESKDSRLPQHKNQYKKHFGFMTDLN